VTRISGSTALITGGASGIGRLVALRLAERGARIVVWDLDGDRAAQAAAPIRGRSGSTAVGYAVDVTDRGQVYAMADRVRADVGDVDIVVNNAGIVSGARLLDIPDEKIERTFQVNTLALYWVTKAFLPAMIEHGRGHIVTVASAAGFVGVARQTDYSASKHAAVGFDESLRVELAQHAPGLRTTAICPYYIDTGMFEGVRTRVPFLLPILKQDKVADQIVRAIERDKRLVVMPPLIRLTPVLRFLPPRAFDKLMDLFGINVSMDHFVGRSTSAPLEPARDRR
jgi:all-trans-retinol dehydrogenase (NAD+)